MDHGNSRWAMGSALRRGSTHVQSTILRCLISPMKHQIGGHKPGDSNEGMLSLDKPRDWLCGVVLKPLQTGARGAREVSFYEATSQRDALRSIVSGTNRGSFAGLTPFLCDYYGVVGFGPTQRYVMLDDCTSHMRRPCALDIKLGTRTTEPVAPLRKQQKTLAKYPCQTELGCRLVGMRVWSQSQSKYLEYDKMWGFSLCDKAMVQQGLVEFFGGHAKLASRQRLIADFGRRLAALLEWFEDQTQLIFISSSLLLVYDGDSDGSLKQSWRRAQLKIIDFAHVRGASMPDFGYVQGLRVVAGLVEDMTLSRVEQ